MFERFLSRLLIPQHDLGASRQESTDIFIAHLFPLSPERIVISAMGTTHAVVAPALDVAALERVGLFFRHGRAEFIEPRGTTLLFAHTRLGFQESFLGCVHNDSDA